VIKINLLPLESFKQTASGQLSVTIFMVAMILGALVLYLANKMVMAPVITRLEASRSDQQTRLSQMKIQSSEALKQTKGFVAELIQVSAISELEERRRDQARLFMALAAQINNQTSWMTSCVHKDGVVTIKGLATDHETVASLLSRLEQVPLLSSVELQRAAGDQIINTVKLVSFDIKANTVFPASSLLENGLPDVNLPDIETVRKLVQVAAPDLAESLDRNRQVARAL
jgi:Tfp pilus assembly protein PilN